MDSEPLCVEVRAAHRWLERLAGLLGHPPLDAAQALCIWPCAAVHTVGMGYAIDLLFISARGRVLRRVRALAPWRAAMCPGAHAVFEVRAGHLVALEPALLRWWAGQCA